MMTILRAVGSSTDTTFLRGNWMIPLIRAGADNLATSAARTNGSLRPHRNGEYTQEQNKKL